MNESLKITQWVLLLSYVMGAFVIGLIFERIILAKLKKIAATTKWQGDVMVQNVVGGQNQGENRLLKQSTFNSGALFPSAPKLSEI